MNRPRVSIVTASYNQAAYIERTIRSVLCQDYANLEYILLDSCSQDGTGAILEKYAKVMNVLIVEKDSGQSDALHRGFQLATGDILGYLNADDCLASGQTISQVVQCFAENPTADVIYGRRNFIDEQGRFVMAHPYRPFCRRTIYLADYIPQEATFWRRGIYQAAGNYIDTSFDFAMDYEMWLRFLSAGAQFLSVPDCWGLFRWYPHQKSQAAWRSHGLPEIARLYDMHLGYRVAEHDMCNYHQAYFFLAHPTAQPASYKFSFETWSRMQQLKMIQLRFQPVDDWAYRTPLNMRRLEHLHWQRARRAIMSSPGRAAWPASSDAVPQSQSLSQGSEARKREHRSAA